MSRPSSHPNRRAKSEPDAKAKVVGVTKDGVRILDQGRATHFTLKELREAVRSVKRAG